MTDGLTEQEEILKLQIENKQLREENQKLAQQMELLKMKIIYHIEIRSLETEYPIWRRELLGLIS